MIGVFVPVGRGNRRDRLGYIVCESGCWEWVGTLDKRGYGRVSDQYVSVKAHRYVWERERGPIPAGLTLDHLCRNPKCVRPDHLEPVDMRTNILRGNCPPARNARATTCKNGHPFDAKGNGGERWCRQCKNERDNRSRRARRNEEWRARDKANRQARALTINRIALTGAGRTE